MEIKKLDYIDTLRGLAILSVIMIHVNLYGRSNLPVILNKIIGEGGKGVQLFFIASAFTLFLSFNKRRSVEMFPVKNFFLRRFFRIAPMYYVGICYYLIQEGLGPRYWLGDETHISVANIVSNVTFLHGFNPYWISSVVPGGWSIAVEMSFYVLIPFLFPRIKNINHAFIFFLISLFIRFILQFLFEHNPLISDHDLWTAYLFLYFPNQLPIFGLGILMYFFIVENQGISQLSGKGILLFSLLLIIQLSLKIDFFLPDHILFGFAFLLLGLALSKFRFKLVVNPILNHIGKVSFSMYLVHFAVLYWLTKLHFIDYSIHGIQNYFTRFIVVTTLTILIASFFYRLVEVPFQKMGSNLINRMESKHSIAK